MQKKYFIFILLVIFGLTIFGQREKIIEAPIVKKEIRPTTMAVMTNEKNNQPKIDKQQISINSSKTSLTPKKINIKAKRVPLNHKKSFTQRLQDKEFVDERSINGEVVRVFKGKVGKHKHFRITEKISANGEIIEEAVVAGQIIVKVNKDVSLEIIEESLKDYQAHIIRPRRYSSTLLIKFNGLNIDLYDPLLKFLNERNDWFNLVTPDYIVSR